jgi:SPP1 family phage portal protein
MESLQEYIKDKYNGQSDWFVSVVNDAAAQIRINGILDKKEYLDGKHLITARQNEKWNGKEFKVRRITLQYAKTILNFATAYLLKNPVTLSGDEKVVAALKDVYNKARLNRKDREILDKMLKYGDCYEYLYFDNDKNILSHIIDPADAYPIYDDSNNLIGFIESWTSADSLVSYYVIYTNENVYQYDNKGGTLHLTNTSDNVSGLPIHYKNQSEVDDRYGRSDLDDYISILDSMEDLLSKNTDALYRYMNGIPVVTGQQLKGEGLPQDVVGGGIVLDDGATFDFKSNNIDRQTFETIHKTLMQSLLDISMTPAVSMNKTDISNLSEVSIQLLYSLADIKASLNAEYLKAGFEQRFDQIRHMLAMQGVVFKDEDYETLHVVFSAATPKNESEIISNLQTLQQMKAISLQSILENVPYVTDVNEELQRVKAESQENNQDTSNNVIENGDESMGENGNSGE